MPLSNDDIDFELETFRKEFWTNERINTFGTLCFLCGGICMAILFFVL